MQSIFRNCVIAVLAFWMLVGFGPVGRGEAQITAPFPLETETAGQSAKEFVVSNEAGAPIDGAYLAGDPDTLKTVWMTGTVDRVIDSTTVQLGVTMRYGDISTNRSMTVSTGAHFWLPPDSWDGIPDSLFRIAPKDTTWARGWQFKIQLRELDRKLLPMTATLFSETRVGGEPDTVYGAAVRADFGRLSLDLTATAEEADSCQVRLGYQVRLRGGDWTGPPGGGLYVLADSLVLVPGATLKLPISIPAVEWFRPVVTGNSRTGNVTISSLKARLN